MTDNAGRDPAFYRREAETFVGIMRDLAPGLRLDYSPASIALLEQFIAAQFDPPGSKFVGDSLPVGIGCYIGEVIIRALAGHWNAEGRAEINGIGPIQAIFPIQKAVKRFNNGPEDSLTWYYETVVRYAGQEQGRQP